MGSKGSASKNSSHLSDEQLAQFQDGELSGKEASHLESCSQCGSRLQDLHAAAMVYLEYRRGFDPQAAAAARPETMASPEHVNRATRRKPSAESLAPVAGHGACRSRLSRSDPAIGSVCWVLPSRLMEQSSIRANELLTRVRPRVRVAKGPPDFQCGYMVRTLIRPVGTPDADAPSERELGTSDVQMVFCCGSLQLARAVKRALVSGVAQWTKE